MLRAAGAGGEEAGLPGRGGQGADPELQTAREELLLGPTGARDREPVTRSTGSGLPWPARATGPTAAGPHAEGPSQQLPPGSVALAVQSQAESGRALGLERG